MALYSKHADKLLKEYGHLGSFEVNCQDEGIAEHIGIQLERRGCVITRRDGSTKISVRCQGARNQNELESACLDPQAMGGLRQEIRDTNHTANHHICTSETVTVSTLELYATS